FHAQPVARLEIVPPTWVSRVDHRKWNEPAGEGLDCGCQFFIGGLSVSVKDAAEVSHYRALDGEAVHVAGQAACRVAAQVPESEVSEVGVYVNGHRSP